MSNQPTVENPEGPPREFSRRVYAVPFGRYEGARPAEYPGNEVLIGRERERARMLDWLLTLGARGAYLVTGYRGVGKTSFVNFCLQRYKEDIYGRWLQSRTGRALFWDRLLIAALFATAALLPLFASQLSDLLSARAAPSSKLVHVCGLVAICLLSLIALYPFVYGCRTLRVALSLSVQASTHSESRLTRLMKSQRVLRVGPVLALVCSLFALLFLPPFGSPTRSAAYFLVVLSFAYLAVHACSLSFERSLKRAPSASGFSKCDDWSRLSSFLLTVLGAVVFLGFAAWLTDPAAFEWLCVATTLVNVAVTFAVRAFDSRQLSEFIARAASPLEEWAAFRAGRARVHRFVAILTASVFVVLSLDSWLHSRPISMTTWVLTSLWGLLALLAARRYRSFRASRTTKTADRRSYWCGFHPRPRILLALKGLFALHFALLIAPVPFHAAVIHFKNQFPLWSLSGALYSDSEAAVTRCLGPTTASLTSLTAVARCPRPFDSALEEGLWLLFAVVIGACFMYLETDWIVRRHARARRDGAYDPEPPEEGHYAGSPSRMDLFVKNRELAGATIFHGIFGSWLPVLTVRVNLGFDELNHTQVVTSMLVGLRNEYHRLFISLRSRLGFISWVAPKLALGVLALSLGDLVARLNLEDEPFARLQALRTPPLFDWRFNPDDHLLSYFLPYGGDRELVLHWHQVAAFVVLIVMTKLLGRYLHVVHHAEIFSRLNAIVAAISSSVRISSRSPKAALRWKAGKLDVGVDGAERTLQSETPPQDPWTLEQTFLDILRDMLAPRVALPFPGHSVSLPVPQITFVFDELDKIGVRTVIPSDDRAEPNGSGTSADHERSRRVHRLLADMKNLLSVAPARFLFVGGRDLHDEWLADQTARQPLLSNIFDAEIYLPTLLVDPLGEEPQRLSGLTGGVEAYLNTQHQRALELNAGWEVRRLELRFFGAGPIFDEHFFVQSYESVKGRAPSGSDPFHTWDMFDVDGAMDKIRWQSKLFKQLSEYLAFRGRGNPKRLNALIESVIVPTGRVLKDNRTLRWARFDCQHVLRLNYASRFSIQLVSAIYWRVAALVDHRASHGDDKNVRSAFYLADFLMKFHRRAFSWSSLERIDEVLHVHRAPDLRGLLEDLITGWSQSLVQQIMSGMHSFRFRSDLAAEIRYVSRLSEPQMAVYNFTLDEAQEHKREYQRRLGNMKDGEAPAFMELRAGLGELFDFDEDYEEARRHYLAAVSALDVWERAREGNPSRGQHEDIAREIQWGVARLRLMLQIGMTYERSRSYERALVEYRSARSLARSLWQIMLSLGGTGPSASQQTGATGASRRQDPEHGRWFDTLKHLFVLYEPLFAMAWVAEKAPTAVDTSTEIVESALAEIRTSTMSAALGRADEFCFAFAALSHNAANLYFFKGRGIDANADERLGYLHQAHYHYACVLHQIRRCFCSLDRFKSANLSPDAWPDLVLRRASSALFGLAETWFAQISVAGLLSETHVSSIGDPLHVYARAAFQRWLYSDGRPAPARRWSIPVPAGSNERDHPWLGGWLELPASGGSTGSPRRDRVLSWQPPATQHDRVRYYLWAGRLGAELLERAGHIEEAAHEFLRIASGVDSLLTTLDAFSHLSGRSLAPPDLRTSLLEQGVSDLQAAARLLSQAAGALPLRREAVTQVVPPHARRLVRTLALSAARGAAKTEDRRALEILRKLEETAAAWAEPEDAPSNFGGTDAASYRSGAREALRDQLERNAYPVLNHLASLHALILDNILSGTRQDDRSHPVHVAELRRLNQEYASPLHFTPFHVGVVLALEKMAEKEAANVGQGQPQERPALDVEARHFLERSRQMCNGRAGYFEAIANLYFLDDDFNDRCIHARHALQMMGTDLVDELLGAPERRTSREPAAAQNVAAERSPLGSQDATGQ